MSFSNEDLQLEEQHFAKVLFNIRYGYMRSCLKRIGHMVRGWRSLDPSVSELCGEYEERLMSVCKCILENQKALNVLTSRYGSQRTMQETDDQIDAQFVENTKSLLRQLVREWSEAGREERAKVYDWIIAKTQEHCGLDKAQTSILVPGAGLGRLAWELAILGYGKVEGNDFSHFMLLPGEHILNYLDSPITVYPHCLPLSNIKDVSDQVRGFTIPDVFPTKLGHLITGEFSMSAGDFEDIYDKEECTSQYDVIASSFFIDTAKNVIGYFKIFKKILRDQGLFINVGPLLYHFEDCAQEEDVVQVHLTWSECKLVLTRLGFSLLEEDSDVETSYVQNPNSLMQTRYKCTRSVWRLSK